MFDRRVARLFGLGGRRPRLPLTRTGQGALAAIVVVVAGGLVWLGLAPQERAPAPTARNIVLSKGSPSEAGPPPAQHPAAGPSSAAPSPATPAPPPPMAVSSVSAAQTYPLSDWSLATVPSGFVDGVRLKGAYLNRDVARHLVPIDVLTVTGWAGDRALGIRFPKVALSLCGRVVASTVVGVPRPDVAKAVHPNLAKAGWSARLLVGQLPRCKDETLAGWGVAPFGGVLFPLSGAWRLDLPPAVPLPPSVRVAPHKLVRPADIPVDPKTVRIQVKGEVNVRRCGSTTCKVVGQLARGSHLAGLLDQADGWALIVVPKGVSGWLAERVIAMEAAKPAGAQ